MHILLGEVSIKAVLPIFNWNVFIMELQKCLYSGCKSSVSICVSQFISLIASFDDHVFFFLMKSNMPNFIFMAHAFCGLSKKSLASQSCKKFFYVFSSPFMAFAFMFKSITHIELMFIDD